MNWNYFTIIEQICFIRGALTHNFVEIFDNFAKFLYVKLKTAVTINRQILLQISLPESGKFEHLQPKKTAGTIIVKVCTQTSEYMIYLLSK